MYVCVSHLQGHRLAELLDAQPEVLAVVDGRGEAGQEGEAPVVERLVCACVRAVHEIKQAFLATSFAEGVADSFIARVPAEFPKVKWRIRIDPSRKCVHVNLVKRTNVPGEEEYLFAPYSAFTVLSVAWNAGTDASPHEIELLAAADNREAREDLPLAPWS